LEKELTHTEVIPKPPTICVRIFLGTKRKEYNLPGSKKREKSITKK